LYTVGKTVKTAKQCITDNIQASHELDNFQRPCFAYSSSSSLP